MRVIRSADYTRMPWRNGGGTTTEIAVFPAGADTSNFEWRLSMARIEQPGPFSLFPGIERTLAILDGDGLHLEVAGRDPICLDKALAPYSFPGDVPVSSALVGGPVLDLNLMSRRSRWRHALVRTTLSGESWITRAGEILLVLVRGGPIGVAGTDTQVTDGDSLLADTTDPPQINILCASRADLYLSHLWRH